MELADGLLAGAHVARDSGTRGHVRSGRARIVRRLDDLHFTYRLSFRDFVGMMAERCVKVADSTRRGEMRSVFSSHHRGACTNRLTLGKGIGAHRRGGVGGYSLPRWPQRRGAAF
jgi:hypothetical protein